VANKVYWRIFERDGWLEYHCSAELQDVCEGKARSQAIRLDSPHRDRVEKGWREEIKNFGDLMVEV